MGVAQASRMPGIHGGLEQLLRQQALLIVVKAFAGKERHEPALYNLALRAAIHVGCERMLQFAGLLCKKQ